MKSKQFLVDTLLLLAVFMGGYATNSWLNSKSNTELLTLQKCDLSNLCFSVDNEEVRVSSQSYIDLIDNKIDGTGKSKWMLERRLGTRPVHSSKLNSSVYEQNEENWYEVYIDLRPRDSAIATYTFTTGAHRQPQLTNYH